MSAHKLSFLFFSTFLFALILSGGILLPMGISYSQLAQVNGTNSVCNTYDNTSIPPTNYGAVYNLFSTAKELLLSATCNTNNTVSFTVGNGQQITYVWSQAYYTRDGQTWTPFALSGANTAGAGQWIVGTAQATQPLTIAEQQNQNYLAAYACIYANGGWKCGCSDTTCAVAKWNLQGIRYVPQNPTPEPTPTPETSSLPTVVYDNDEIDDAYTDEYLMALASAGEINLRGIITSSSACESVQPSHDPTNSSQAPSASSDGSQWNGSTCYNRWVSPAAVNRMHQERIDKVAVARASGMTGIPDPVLGTPRHLRKPTSGVIEQTTPINSAGSRLLLEEAYKATAQNPLIVVMGGPLTVVADAYLMSLADSRGDISDKILVKWIGGNTRVSPYNTTGYNGWADGWATVIASQRLPLEVFPAELGLNKIPFSKCGVLPHRPNIPSGMQIPSICPSASSVGNFPNMPGPFKDELYFKGVRSTFGNGTPMCGPNELIAGFNTNGCSQSTPDRFWSVTSSNRYHGDTDVHPAIVLVKSNYITGTTSVCFDKEVSAIDAQPHPVAQFKSASQCQSGQRLVTFMTSANISVGESELIRALNNSAAYGSTRYSIPGTIQAENFRAGGEGTAYHDTTRITSQNSTSGNSGGRYRNNDVDISAISGGYAVTNTASTEWIEYDVNVTQAGSYDVRLRVAATGAGSARVTVGATSADIPVSNTGGANNFSLTAPVTANLSAGAQTLRLTITQGGFNIDAIELQKN